MRSSRSRSPALSGRILFHRSQDGTLWLGDGDHYRNDSTLHTTGGLCQQLDIRGFILQRRQPRNSDSERPTQSDRWNMLSTRIRTGWHVRTRHADTESRSLPTGIRNSCKHVQRQSSHYSRMLPQVCDLLLLAPCADAEGMQVLLTLSPPSAASTVSRPPPSTMAVQAPTSRHIRKFPSV